MPAKKTIEDCHILAAQREGICLALEYPDAMTPIPWKCKEGHVWNACYSSIKNAKSWCPFCVGQIKHTIEECHDLAILRGGECLSQEYASTDSPLLWRCKCGFEWTTSFRKVKNGH